MSALPCLALSVLKTVILSYILVSVFLVPPRCVHRDRRPLTPAQSKFPWIQSTHHGKECHARVMDLKSCRAHRNSFKSSCLVLFVHGDSSGAGGSSCYGHGGHSQLPASPIAEMEAVAEGPCEGPRLLVLPIGSLSFRA